jgi:hypothetical protein
MPTKQRPRAVPVEDPAEDKALTELLLGLSISPESVLADAGALPMQFFKAATYRVGKMRLAAAADMEMDRVQSELDASIRQAAIAIGDKLTEPSIKATILRSEVFLSALSAKTSADADEESAKLLVEAFRIKRDCMKVISELTNTERAMEAHLRSATAPLKGVRDTLDKKYPGRPL